MDWMINSRLSQGAAPLRFNPVYFLRLILFSLLILFGGLYILFSPVLNKDFFYDKVLLQRQKCSAIKTDWPGRHAEEVSFKNNKGAVLSGLFFDQPHASHVILLHHGSGGNLLIHARCMDYLLNDGANAVLIYDYSGYGKSTGTPTLSGLSDDGQAAYDYLVNQRHISPKRIVNYGVSLGTGVATSVAANKPCAGLVLFAPYTCVKDAARDRYWFLKFYPDFLVCDEDLNTLSAMKRVTVPVFIAHGAMDQTISVKNSDRLFAAVHGRKEYMRIEDGGHTQFTSPEQPERLVHFIESL